MKFDPTRLREIKLIFAGLNNAGKTSFLIALRKKYNFYDNVRKLKPTIMIDYSSFNFLNQWQINCWDMGGQEKYRSHFVDKPVYFSDTDFLYYIIDIQDDKKYDESISYLKTLISVFQEIEYSREIIVCFNKLDPDLKNRSFFLDQIEILKKRINSLTPVLKFKFFNTTIFDISSLSKAMAFSLNMQLNLDRIHLRLENLVNTFNLKHAILYTDYGLVISDYYDKPIDSKEFEESVFKRINKNMIFIQKVYDNNMDFTDVFFDYTNQIEYLKKIDVSSSTRTTYVFITILGETLNKTKLAQPIFELKETLEEVLI
jgi:GTPase SAR1 family protein